MEFLIFKEGSFYRWDAAGADYDDGVIHAERLEFDPDMREWRETGTWEEFQPVPVLELLTEKLSGATEAIKAHTAEQKREFEGMYHYLSAQIKKRKGEGAE